MEGSNTPSFPAQGRFSTQRRKKANQSVGQSAVNNPESGEGNVPQESVDTPMQNGGENPSSVNAGTDKSTNSEEPLAVNTADDPVEDKGGEKPGNQKGGESNSLPEDLVDSSSDSSSADSTSDQAISDEPEEDSFDEEDSEPSPADSTEDPVQDGLDDHQDNHLPRDPNYEEVVSPDFKVKPKPNRKKGTRKTTQSKPNSGSKNRPTKKSSRTQGNHSSTPPRGYGGTGKRTTALDRIEAASTGNVKMLGVPSRRGAKHNWELISKEYIEGVESTDPKDTNRIFYSMRELGDRHGVSDQMVRARAAKERWTEKKEAHAMRLARERIRKRQATLVNKGVDFDDKALQVAELGMGMVTQRLAEIAQEVTRRRKIRDEALAKIDAGLPVDKTDLYSAVNYREMEGLASAASRFQEIGMKALGTDVQRHEISGPEGDAIEVKTNIRHEITRDDPERIAAIVSSFEDAGLLELGTIQEIIDAEIVEDESTGAETDMDAPDSTEDEQ